MPTIQRNNISLNNLVYTTGYYVNPNWIVSLSPSKVGSGTAQWNASSLQGNPILNITPASGQVLAWSTSGWIPSGISSYSGSGSISTLGAVTLDGTVSGTLSTTNSTLLDSSPISSGDCIKYIIKAKHSTDIQSSEILLVANNGDSYMTQYGIVYTSSLLANFSTSISGSYINLYAQATNNNTDIKLFKTIIN
jgi:hypothetical protein